MLNVPESVKALFKQDGIRKNFRVHFPGGELPDITNDNVVRESVRFTESLCSQDVLKFGLTEASVLEFETVGVANMYGMTIEAGIEINLSSLSAAELAEIEAGSWDGVYVSESDTDLGFPFFRVPYGVFRVESCPRDHQAMTHRKVTAYSFGGQMRNSDYELGKLSKMTAATTYTPDVVKLIYAAAAWQTGRLIRGTTRTPYSAWSTWPPTTRDSATAWQYEKRNTQGQATELVKIEVLGYTAAIIHFSRTSGSVPWDGLYSLDLNGPSGVPEALQTAAAAIDARNNDFLSRWKQSILSVLKKILSVNASTTGASISAESIFCSRDGDWPAFYPYGKNTWFWIPTETTVRITYTPTPGATTQSMFSFNVTLIQQEPTIYEYSDLPDPLTISISKPGNDSSGGTFADSYDINDLANGYLELNAQFGRVSRAGDFEMMRLQNENPVPIPPGEFSEFWWDEYDVLPIGEILYNFTDKDNQENTVSYAFGEGASVYDATGNAVLKAMGSATQDTTQALLDSNFIAYLGPVAFTPIDLTMKGLPYLEAGDYLAVTGGDGTTANSYNMRQEIQGIQALEASIESTSGQIIDSGEAEQ